MGEVQDKQVKRRKKKYNWALIAELYVRHNYTTTDLHLIFGPVPGHIQKVLVDAGVNRRNSGGFRIPHTPDVFSKELNQKIKEVPGLGNRIDTYYKRVIVFKALSKIRELREEGLSQRAVSDALGGQISKTTVGKWDKKFENKSSRELYELMKKNRGVFEAQVRAKKQGA